ncbi:MAG: FAD-binding oxidoreductase [Ignavibacteriales bacterium]|nr:MAG: FAD-binding oxidoreductase [Ignavibacteriales bacterium]
MIIKTTQDEIQNYLSDASNFKGFCESVFIPENVDEVRDILIKANELNTSVTISGNGTGLTGARVPQGGIVISTERLNKIHEINVDEKYAVVEPGVLLSHLLSQLKQKKLLYPPDPTEKNCFIGGTICTNASGEKTFRYASTRDYILELEIVLTNGEVIHLKRGESFANAYNIVLNSEQGSAYSFEIPETGLSLTKNAAGYYCRKNMDTIDLFIGSEGTLGIVTKAKLKLLPYPEKIISCVSFFMNENDALSFINEARILSRMNISGISASSMDALALEFFDNNSLKFLFNDYPNIPDLAGAAVWFEQETNIISEETVLDEWTDLIKKHNGNTENVWFAFSESEAEKIQRFRHSISANVNEFLTRNNFRKLGTDVAVPDESFNDLYHYSKKITEEKNINYVVYGHFGNSHMHFNFLPETEEQFALSKDLYHKICLRAIELKGTVSAEHGVGKIKRDYLKLMYGDEAVQKMITIKKILDPNMILCRGNLFE